MKMPDCLKTCLVCKKPVALNDPDRMEIQVNMDANLILIGPMKIPLVAHKKCLPPGIEAKFQGISMSSSHTAPSNPYLMGAIEGMGVEILPDPAPIEVQVPAVAVDAQMGTPDIQIEVPAVAVGTQATDSPGKSDKPDKPEKPEKPTKKTKG